MTHVVSEPDDDPLKRLVSTARKAAPDRLRDVHVFSHEAHQALYVRGDVAEQIDEADLDRYIDQERHGSIVAETYDSLNYTGYRYTVRGFSSFEQFRTFVGPERSVGILVSFDRSGQPIDYQHLDDQLQSVANQVGPKTLGPTP